MLLARSLSDARLGGSGWLEHGGRRRVRRRAPPRRGSRTRARSGASWLRLSRVNAWWARSLLWYKQEREPPPRTLRLARVRPPRASRAPLVLGVDLGKVTTSLALGELRDDGELRVLETRAERHLGDPLRPFLDLYRRARLRPTGRRRRDGRLRRAPRRARARRRSRGDRPGVGRRLALPGRSAQRGPHRRRRLLGAHPRRRRGSCATRPTSAARPAPARPSKASAPGSAARSTTPSRWRRPAPTASPSPAAAPCSPRASSRTSPTRASRTGASSAVSSRAWRATSTVSTTRARSTAPSCSWGTARSSGR